MKKNIAISIGAVMIVIAAVSIFMITNERIEQKSGINPTKWIISGNFALQKYEHKLGENVFMVVEGLKIDEKGAIIIATPEGNVYKKIPFDGSFKAGFNTYFKPDTSKAAKLCTPEELVGVWTIFFEGTEHQSLQFEIIDEYVIGAEEDLITLC